MAVGDKYVNFSPSIGQSAANIEELDVRGGVSGAKCLGC